MIRLYNCPGRKEFGKRRWLEKLKEEERQAKSSQPQLCKPKPMEMARIRALMSPIMMCA
jgi:hypothetical protein